MIGRFLLFELIMNAAMALILFRGQVPGIEVLLWLTPFFLAASAIPVVWYVRERKRQAKRRAT